MERWLGHLTVLLEAMVADETCTLAQLPLLTEPEREQLVHGFNATEAAYPGEALIHELFEQQVGRAPEALAVEYEDERLTYAQLNARANQLAHRLRGLKDASGAPLVGPDALVAISVERSLEMVVGLLGILKAGAAVRAGGSGVSGGPDCVHAQGLAGEGVADTADPAGAAAGSGPGR